MASDFKDVRAAIKTALDALNKVAVVYDHPVATIAEIPAVIIAPSDNEADYASTGNDKVTFVFKLRAYYTIQEEGNQETAERALEEVVDEILTSFRQRDILGSAADWVEPVPSVWEWEARGEAVYRVAEITLRCRKYVVN